MHKYIFRIISLTLIIALILSFVGINGSVVADSAIAISNMQYHYDGTVMQITVWKVLSSPLNRDGDICLYYEIMDETEIWLGGKRIWSAK